MMKNFPTTWKDIVKKYYDKLKYCEDFSTYTKKLKGRDNYHTLKMRPDVYEFIEEMGRVMRKNPSYIFDKIVLEYIKKEYTEIRREEEKREI